MEPYPRDRPHGQQSSDPRLSTFVQTSAYRVAPYRCRVGGRQALPSTSVSVDVLQRYDATWYHVTEETVRVYLHTHDYVCKRSTWTLRRKAEEKADYVGNACG